MIMEQFFTQLNDILAFIKDLGQRGIVKWTADQDYKEDARVVGNDGILYKALKDTGPNMDAAAQDPETETADPREVWEREVPAPVTPAPEMKPIAWGRMKSNGTLDSDAYGVDTVNSGREEDAGVYTYEIRLSGDALAAPCMPIVVPSPIIDGRTAVTELTNGFDVKLGHGSSTGIARTFFFVVFGVK